MKIKKKEKKKDLHHFFSTSGSSNITRITLTTIANMLHTHTNTPYIAAHSTNSDRCRRDTDEHNSNDQVKGAVL